ncbi:MAG: nucleotide pyrophosphohydrolase [Elusimicrobia bacterium]|nr:nucleotide pyrophosphohydrolase [Elusimicrobiota bacterium]
MPSRPSTTDKLACLSSALAAFARERDWEQFHSPKNLAMALSVEASELVEIFQWLTEEQSKRLPPEKVQHLREELADTFIFLLKLADHYKVDLIEAAHQKLEKNAKKYPVEKAKGSAKKYDEL